MEITVKMTPKEMADLVLALQGQHETMEIIKNSLGEEIKVCQNEKDVELYPQDFSKFHQEVIRAIRKDNSSKEEKKMNNSEKAFSYITGLVMKGDFKSIPFSSEFFQEAAIALRQKIDQSKGCQWCMNPLPNTNVFMQDCDRIVLDIPLRFCPNCGRYLRRSSETGTSHSA